MPMPTCNVASRWIEGHFEGKGRHERELRSHLPGCSTCREYYERWMLAEQLDPSGLGAERRLAVALGFGTTQRTDLVRFWAPLAAAAAIILVSISALRAPTEFHARGAAFVAKGPELSVYRFSSAREAVPVRGEIRRSDELAFAYRGMAGLGYLLVYGRDEHGHVYWYYPEWTDAKLDPAAIAISTEPQQHELPTAISHNLDATELELCGVFSRRVFHVHEIEALLGQHSAQKAIERLEGVSVTCRTLRVVP